MGRISLSSKPFFRYFRSASKGFQYAKQFKNLSSAKTYVMCQNKSVNIRGRVGNTNPKPGKNLSINKLSGRNQGGGGGPSEGHHWHD